MNKKVTSNLKLLMSKGLKQPSAIRRLLKKYKSEFQDLFNTEMLDSEGSEDEDDNDNPDNDDDDSEEKNE